MVARPARVIGVSAAAMSDSLESKVGATGRCESIEGGRPDDTVWRCGRAGSGNGVYVAVADEWGCWRSKRADGRGPVTSACIWLWNYVR